VFMLRIRKYNATASRKKARKPPSPAVTSTLSGLIGPLSVRHTRCEDHRISPVHWPVRECQVRQTGLAPAPGSTHRTPQPRSPRSVSYTHLRAHETVLDLVCRLLLEKK